MPKMESGVRRMVGAACALALLAALPAGAQTNSWPAPESYVNKNFDSGDSVKITGEVAGVETIDGAVIFWVTAKKAEKAGFGARPGMDVNGAGMLWRVEGSGVAKVKDAASVAVGAKITVTGDNSTDKSCKPSCRMRADKVSVK